MEEKVADYLIFASKIIPEEESKAM
jgi:hypothetical protein